ncbi:hypothetical protein DDQ50_16220 [Amnibacterium flavum]|uniref:Transcriptional regulator LacI/GalR-like sensor domain-containing protein n=2 Tax=Amnibacterium flavum TaxID=2173173 RepID=A0A2V1HQQ4_9MICO|nr:hypothetical protein DDQ50_16220 [Amnibacterium flavum]
MPEAVISLGELPKHIRRVLARSGVRRVASMSRGNDGLLLRETSAAEVQVGYLAECGHNRILYVGSTDSSLAAINETRHAAVRRYGDQLGMQVVTTVAAIESDAFAEELKARSEDGFTAAAAYNDEIAFATLGAAHRGGLRIPDELAVIGIDDLPLAAVSYPRLTTVTNEPADMPSRAAFIDSILAGATIQATLLQPRVIVRESA